MAATSILFPAMNGAGHRDIHPFFTKSTDPSESLSLSNSNEVPVKYQLEGTRADGDLERSTAQHESQENAIPEAVRQEKKTQSTLKHVMIPASGAEHQHMIIHGNSGSSPCAQDVVQSEATERSSTNTQEDLYVTQQFPPTADLTPKIVSQLPHNGPQTPPKKVLRLRPNGTLASPPTLPDSQVATSNVEGGKKRGRPRKNKGAYTERKVLVRCRYGSDEGSRTALGAQIDRILAGIERIQAPTTKQATQKKPRTPRKPYAIFASKAKTGREASCNEQAPRKASAVTPGKLRTQTIALGDRVSGLSNAPYCVGADLLKDRFLVKQPGAKEPAWPSKYDSHVRGYTTEERTHLKALRTERIFTAINRRKGKAADLPLPPNESVLQNYAETLVPEQQGALRIDGFCDPHPSLRVPARLFISGDELAEKTVSKLLSSVAELDEIDLAKLEYSQRSSHPALRRQWQELPTYMTAWDVNEGESLAWTQKYAPSTAADVLQPPQEMQILKEWLASHTVTAVNSTGASDTKSAKQEARPKKRRRKRRDDLDGFLVDSDEEYHSMSELVESQEGHHSLTSTRSLVQDLSGDSKAGNVVLLSGRHGCGKTAAVYAVAKELDFKVFEISSQERRSGRDVMDRVGDMTENHIVRHHGQEAGDVPTGEGTDHVDDALRQDLVSGRQGTMNSFFKAMPPPKPKEPIATKVLKKQTLEAVQQALKKSNKTQQQSLILLEEVDVLFKEDKDFWTTIFKLIQSSKRPFVMTCNDEDMVPVQAMSPYAILRFAPVPKDLAVDYLLMISAKEGHLLSRHSVESLYQYRRQDLRASITELEFWCQMGVGDARGGLEWLYQRWPLGSGTNEEGRPLRVISGDTYSQWNLSKTTRNDDEETEMLRAWQEFGIAPAKLLGWPSLTSSIFFDETLGAPNDTQRRQNLKRLGKFADAMSDCDLLEASGHCESVNLATDLPVMPEKARVSYIEGLRLLQTDEMIDHKYVSEQLAISVTSRAFKRYSICSELEVRKHIMNQLSCEEEGDCAAAALTRRDFACFDAIAVPADANGLGSSGSLQVSAFDGTFSPIVLDIAPYVRSIVMADSSLLNQREQLSIILEDGQGGRKPKRARTTRAARSALEGSQRANTRKEHWFSADLNAEAVLATGSVDWPLPQATESTVDATTVTPPTSSADTEPTHVAGS